MDDYIKSTFKHNGAVSDEDDESYDNVEYEVNVSEKSDFDANVSVKSDDDGDRELLIKNDTDLDNYSIPDEKKSFLQDISAHTVMSENGDHVIRNVVDTSESSYDDASIRRNGGIIERCSPSRVNYFDYIESDGSRSNMTASHQTIDARQISQECFDVMGSSAKSLTSAMTPTRKQRDVKRNTAVECDDDTFLIVSEKQESLKNKEILQNDQSSKGGHHLSSKVFIAYYFLTLD